MKSFLYRKKWCELIQNGVKPEELSRLSCQIAYSFLDHYLKDCRYEASYIDLLCEMMTFTNDPEYNNPGARALFSIIVERLCDDFEELQTETYNRLMTHVISYCRHVPQGKELDTRLKEFDLFSPIDFYHRNKCIRYNNNSLADKQTVHKILLLSRVTIGADVAITSIIIQRLRKMFPNAQIVLMGDNKLGEVYGGNRKILLRHVNYSKKGGLIERLSSWHHVLDIIADETKSCFSEAFMLIDPDSRLSQLGILPLVSLDRYFFFDSRTDTAFNQKLSMPELTNAWMNHLTGEDNFCYPKVWIPEAYLKNARVLINTLRERGIKKCIVINFGVGGNPRKQVGLRFEENLLLTLLKEPQTAILLDKGFGEQELAHSHSLLRSVENYGYAVAHICLGETVPEHIRRGGIIGIESSIGEMAALIANCNEFIGYDSACQHIAAATGTPCITIFAGSNNMRFIRRWSAHGPGTCNIVHVDTLSNPSIIDVNDIIVRVMHTREMRCHLNEALY
jgi:ADP-heptose:LPS heptosyltransferase